MKKIVYIPLDDRPCNSQYVSSMWEDNDITLVTPPEDILGYKKEPAILNKIYDFIFTNIADAEGIILSLDMLLYGGIVPSRLHYQSIVELQDKLNLVKKIKQINPKIKIYAFELVMRNPQYNSDDEEPFYYQTYGKAIFLSGYYKQKAELGLLTDEEKEDYANLELKQIYLDDYLERRRINNEVNLLTLDLLKEKIIDFLVIPIDDTSVYGYCSMDKQRIIDKINKLNLNEKVLIYPGADEVGEILTARLINKLENKEPKIYVKYFPENACNIIPKLEDRKLQDTVNAQITSSGSVLTDNEDDADLIFVVSSTDTEMQSSPTIFYEKDYYKTTTRKIVPIIEYVKEQINNSKNVMIADVVCLNGGEKKLLQALDREDLIFKLAGYAGWNTSSNSLGCAIAQGVMYLYQGDSFKHKSFLAARYLEDVVYGGSIKNKMSREKISRYGCNYFHTDGKRGKCSQLAYNLINGFTEKYFANLFKHYVLVDCYMPWARMFEICLKVEYKD